MEAELASLKNHRRALIYALALLVAMLAVFLVVGRHPGRPGTTTTLPFVGRFDQTVYDAMGHIRTTVLTWVAKALNVLGGGIVTIPLRIIVALFLVIWRRWRGLSAWMITWILAEVMLRATKAWFARPRPPHPLVLTTGFSFPSGHAVAASATAVAIVLIAVPPGLRRRKWELLTILFSFVMAMSRVYLNAHWFSDVVAGVLLGTGVAVGSAALVTEIRNLIVRRRAMSAWGSRAVTAGPRAP
ncbi:MAG: phosphatase PAP2 family protein [Actinomycetota bacterium]